jgi:hypothetical protein
MKKAISTLIKKIGWFSLFEILLEIATDQNDEILAREIECTMYNHVPEVR